MLPNVRPAPPSWSSPVTTRARLSASSALASASSIAPCVRAFCAAVNAAVMAVMSSSVLNASSASNAFEIAALLVIAAAMPSLNALASASAAAFPAVRPARAPAFFAASSSSRPFFSASAVLRLRMASKAYLPAVSPISENVPSAPRNDFCHIAPMSNAPGPVSKPESLPTWNALSGSTCAPPGRTDMILFHMPIHWLAKIVALSISQLKTSIAALAVTTSALPTVPEISWNDRPSASAAVLPLA